MTTFVSTFIESLVIQEIDRIVADAKADRSTLSTSAAITQIMRDYPNAGLKEADLAKRIIVAALAAGVMLELDQEHAEQQGAQSVRAISERESP